VTKPYDFPKGKRDIKKERFIFNEHFAPNHKVMVQRSNLSNIKERRVFSQSPPKTIKQIQQTRKEFSRKALQIPHE